MKLICGILLVALLLSCVGCSSIGSTVSLKNTPDNALEVADKKIDIVDADASTSFVAVVYSDGTVAQQGSWFSDPIDSSTSDPSKWTGVTDIAVGDMHIAGLKSDGTVVIAATSPEKAAEQSDALNWSNVRAIWANNYATIGLTADGKILTAGKCASGSALSGITDAAVGTIDGSIIALKADGTCDKAGTNADGALRVDDWKDIVQVAYANAHSVGLKSDGTVVSAGAKASNRCDVESWKDVVEVAVGKAHTVGLKRDGTVVATGKGKCVTDTSVWKDIKTIRAGGQATIGITNDGKIVLAGMESASTDIDVDSFNSRVG